MLLMDLLHQQGERRAQLFSTLKTMEEKNTMEDFWLRQYQQLVERYYFVILNGPTLGAKFAMVIFTT